MLIFGAMTCLNAVKMPGPSQKSMIFLDKNDSPRIYKLPDYMEK